MKKEFKVTPEMMENVRKIGTPALGVKRLVGTGASRAFQKVKDPLAKSLNDYLKKHSNDKVRSYVKNPFKSLVK